MSPPLSSLPVVKNDRLGGPAGPAPRVRRRSSRCDDWRHARHATIAVSRHSERRSRARGPLLVSGAISRSRRRRPDPLADGLVACTQGESASTVVSDLVVRYEDPEPLHRSPSRSQGAGYEAKPSSSATHAGAGMAHGLRAHRRGWTRNAGADSTGALPESGIALRRAELYEGLDSRRKRALYRRRAFSSS